MLECDYNNHNQKDYCENNPKPKLQDVCKYPVDTRIHKKYSKYTERICELSALSDFNTITPSKFVKRDGSTIMKRVAEHLGRKPSIPVATVCIIYVF